MHWTWPLQKSTSLFAGPTTSTLASSDLISSWNCSCPPKQHFLQGFLVSLVTSISQPSHHYVLPLVNLLLFSGCNLYFLKTGSVVCVVGCPRSIYFFPSFFPVRYSPDTGLRLTPPLGSMRESDQGKDTLALASGWFNNGHIWKRVSHDPPYLVFPIFPSSGITAGYMDPQEKGIFL